MRLNKEILLNVKNLCVSTTEKPQNQNLINDISFEIKKNEIVGLIGESGSGKSLTSLSILGLLEKNKFNISGEIIFNKKNLLNLDNNAMMQIRGAEISMIFQEPMSALNPTMKIGKQLFEVFKAHENLSFEHTTKRIKKLIKKVKLDNVENLLEKYPHQISGGQKQRVMIVMALSSNPKLLIADEPTTALDVTIEAEILNLIQELKSELNMSMLMITHDLGVIGEVTDEVAVMYVGKVVERTSTKKLFSEPLHPYTKALFKSRPRINSSERLSSIDGTVPSPYSQTKGCSFAPRCEVAMDICKNKSPELIDLGEHHVSCWKYNKEEI